MKYVDKKANILGIVFLLLVCIVIFYEAIFSDGVITTTDTLSKEYPWKAVMKEKSNLERYSHSDVTAVWYPWKMFLSRELHKGNFPLWSNEVACGYPVFATGMLDMYGITTIFLWLFPAWLGNNITFIVQTFIGLLGMFLLLRFWKMGLATSLLGGIAFGISYPMMEWMVAESVSGALIMLPWIILFLEKYSLKKHFEYFKLFVRKIRGVAQATWLERPLGKVAVLR